MIEGVCRVCGSQLAEPLVICPECATPHHQDCWEYNRGCTIFGCTGTAVARSMPVPVPENLPAPPTAEAPRYRTALTLIGLGLVGKLFGPYIAGLVVMALFDVLVIKIKPAPIEEPVRTAEDNIELEIKEVSRLIGNAAPAELAQAYALFEQRHPKAVLPGDRQSRLAGELLAAGHVVLGLEALEKLTQGQDPVGFADVTMRRREVLLPDPAFFDEALGGPDGLDLEHSRAALAAYHPSFTTATQAEPLEEAAYLLACSSRGFADGARVATEVPSIRGKRHVSPWLAGPFEPDDVEPEIAARLAVGTPLFVVAARLIELPPIEPVEWIHVSQKGVRVRTSDPVPALEATEAATRRQRPLESSSSPESSFDWTEIVELFFTRLDTREQQTTMVRDDHFSGRGGRVTTYKTEIKEEVHTRPLIEILAGNPLRRLRIDGSRVGMFDYLGRRKEASHAFNAVLVVKDLVRFGPAVRASHGVHCLFGERTGPGMRFTDAIALEHGRHWFHAAGTAGVRRQWAEVLRGRLAG